MEEIIFVNSKEKSEKLVSMITQLRISLLDMGYSVQDIEAELSLEVMELQKLILAANIDPELL